MEARVLGVLVLIVALGVSSSAGQYVGLCKYFAQDGGRQRAV